MEVTDFWIYLVFALIGFVIASAMADIIFPKLVTFIKERFGNK